MGPFHHQQGQFYDPVASQSGQRSGYTYQQSATIPSTYPNASATAYPSSTHSTYGSSSGSIPQYGTAHQTPDSNSQASRASTSRLNHNLNTQAFTQQSAAATPTTYNANANSDPSWGTGTYVAGGFETAGTRSQSTSAATSYTAVPGRPKGPDSSQSPSNNYSAHAAPGPQAYHTGYPNPSRPQSQQQPPQRYNSPLHAVQAQQRQQHLGQSSHAMRLSNQPSSSHVSADQQQSNARASVEPPPMTVDPSQVYDARAEQQRRAQIDAERRRLREEEAAKRKAEEDQIAEDKRRIEEEKAREDKENADKEAAEQLNAELTAAKKLAEKKRKADNRHKANEERKRSQTAASALQQMASSGAEATPSASQSTQVQPIDDEAQLRAMFAKMREFNAKNPAMLAKLWEEERKFATSEPPPQSSSVAPAPAPPSITASTSIANPAPEVSQHASLPAPNSAHSIPNMPPSITPFKKPAIPSTSKAVTGPKPYPQSLSDLRGPTSMYSPLWPPHKKDAVSEAAVKWLKKIPENANKVIQECDVLKILDRNPSYSELCKGLEKLGLKFERATLARELLRVIPEDSSGRSYENIPALVKSNSVAKRAGQKPSKNRASAGNLSSVSSTQSTGTTVTYEAPGFTLADGAQRMNGVGKAVSSIPTTQTSPYFASSGSQPPPYFQSSAESRLGQNPSEPPRPPANKEEAARKRGFADLVDLTEDDSDDDGPPPKMLGLQPPAGFPPRGAWHQQPGQVPFLPNSGSHGHGPQPFAGMGVLVPPRPDPYAAAMQPIHAPPVQTIRAPAALAKPIGPTPEQLQHERVKGKMLVEPIVRDRVARKSSYDSRTIARDVLLATGRHPDMRPLNQHLVVMSKLLSDHGAQHEADGVKGFGLRCDLNTIRWDIIDPAQPAPISVAAVRSLEARSDAQEMEDARIQHESDLIRHAAPTETRTGGDPLTQLLPAEPPPKKKIGRPRKRPLTDVQAGASQSAKDASRETAAGQTAAENTPTRHPAASHLHSQSPSAMSSGGGAIGYAAFRSYDENGDVIKTKGRPRGWKKSVHSREAQGFTPAKMAPKSTKQSNVKSLVAPQFQIFKCEWEGCPAELHNLETLKKHVIKLHDHEDDQGAYACRWKSCPTTHSLPDFQAWTEHIYNAHMSPIAWKQGDGPKGGIFDYDPSDAEAYLSDAQGRSVTPLIDPDSASADLHPAIATAELQVLIDHKRIVGPSFEKTGCTLANAKRRRGFLEDEDFEHHYEEDDPRF